jgi:peroxiredoxin
MPSFILPDERGQLVRLESLLEKGAVAISFNRGHWCPYCRLNTVALVGAQRRVAVWGGQLVAIVPERQKFTMALQTEAQAPFPILTDMDNGYALSLNLAYWIGDEMTRFLAGAGCPLPQFQGNETWTLPIPATFVVDRDGYVAARHIDPDYRKRMEIDALVDALAAAHQ